MSRRRFIMGSAALVPAPTIAFLLFARSIFGPGAESLERHDVLTGPPAPTAGARAIALDPEPSPSLTQDACGQPVDGDYLAANQILSYYGNPEVPAMGILGEIEPDQLVAKLDEHAAKYDGLNGPLGVRGALHFVHATAQPEPGPAGTYLQYAARSTLKRYINLACQNGFLMFVDLQIGHSDVAAEVRKVLPYLEHPNVHLALDPEFAMPGGQVPGETIGTLDADDINLAQEIVQAFIEANGLTDKMIVVHRFTDEMITRSELIEDFANVHLVIDMDGFGPSEIKRVKYGWYASPAEYAGIKLFFRQDPDLMSEEDVLTLEPDVIIYQ